MVGKRNVDECGGDVECLRFSGSGIKLDEYR